MQDYSNVYLFMNGDDLPPSTGQYIYPEFKPNRVYCILPSNEEVLLLGSYEKRPAFLDQYKKCFPISTVI